LLVSALGVSAMAVVAAKAAGSPQASHAPWIRTMNFIFAASA